VRPDGQRLVRGALPTLIQWGATHPADHLPDSAGDVLTKKSATTRRVVLGLAEPAIP
jgi:hypothetical protein